MEAQAPAGESLMVQRMRGQGHTYRYAYSRRALLLAPPYGRRESYGASQGVAGAGEEAPVADPAAGSSFDANVVMILAVLLCALICALGVNCLVRCALRCSGQMMSHSPAAGGGGERTELGAVARLAQAGARRKALRAMPTMVYSAAQRPAAGRAPACAICLADLEPGERVRVLPKCNHAFHVRCVDRWLLARSTCPTCRQPLFGAPQKASVCADAGTDRRDDGGETEPPRPSLAPLRPEGFMTPYDF